MCRRPRRWRPALMIPAPDQSVRARMAAAGQADRPPEAHRPRGGLRHHARRARGRRRRARHPAVHRRRGRAALPALRASRRAAAVALATRDAGNRPGLRGVGVDEYRRYVFLVEPDGAWSSSTASPTARPTREFPVPGLEPGTVVVSSSRSLLGNYLAAGTDDGRVALMQVGLHAALRERAALRPRRRRCATAGSSRIDPQGAPDARGQLPRAGRPQVRGGHRRRRRGRDLADATTKGGEHRALVTGAPAASG